jgi:DNA polymerase III delta prime subunit
MTKNAQQALKTLLQTYSSNVRFCLICNYISKIDESLQQELICVRFNQLPGEEISKFMRHIAEMESFLLTDDQIDMMKETYQSDIRSMINFLQLSFMDSRTLTGSTNIVPLIEWNKLHNYLSRGEENDAIGAIMELSVKHNIDKKQILLNYMNYVVKNQIRCITEELLCIFEQTSHSKDDMRSYDLVCFFVSNVVLILDQMRSGLTESSTLVSASY